MLTLDDTAPRDRLRWPHLYYCAWSVHDAHLSDAASYEHAAKRQTDGVKFTPRQKFSIFAQQGRLVAPIYGKFVTAEGHMGPLGRAKLQITNRKFSSAYVALWGRIASPIMNRFRCSFQPLLENWKYLQCTKRFVVLLLYGTTRFANLRRKFSKTQKIGRRVVSNTSHGYYWDSY